ncbi:MAG: SGNH/GDSL hydrolase family protein [Candidatus Thiodiazotropha sp. (ex Semelilucina semeliformis)]|nr:SGNH/GDSL hydrolase family protein [Candidatus Thiodiazotropha sp. (ex Semelilucina semeliformis)]
MKILQYKSYSTSILLLLLLLPCLSHADKPFERMVVFGDSLSDPGNAFFLTGRKLKPPYDTLDAFLIPDAPYARGGNHFSNGETWVEQFAEPLDLGDSTGPAFKGENEDELKMTNYAVGGARAHEDSININLASQVGAFFADSGGIASSDALYVVALGGNDIRDAIAAFAIDNTGAASSEILTKALTAISDNIIALYSAGARKMMIGNAPDVSLTPAIRRLDLVAPGTSLAALLLSAGFNSQLDLALNKLSNELAGLEIAQLNLFTSMQDLVTNPREYGLKNVENACVMPNQKPAACKKPKRYLFWDGIHPTKAAHRILASKAHIALMQIN